MNNFGFYCVPFLLFVTKIPTISFLWDIMCLVINEWNDMSCLLTNNKLHYPNKCPYLLFYIIRSPTCFGLNCQQRASNCNVSDLSKIYYCIYIHRCCICHTSYQPDNVSHGIQLGQVQYFAVQNIYIYIYIYVYIYVHS
jgi:hypothetical protein